MVRNQRNNVQIAHIWNNGHLNEEKHKVIRKSLKKEWNSPDLADSLSISKSTLYKAIEEIQQDQSHEQILSARIGRLVIRTADLSNPLSHMLIQDASYIQNKMIKELSIQNKTASQLTISRKLKQM